MAGDIAIRATLADGRTLVRDPTARAVLAQDPAGGEPWVVAREPAWPRPSRPMACVSYRQRAPGRGTNTHHGRYGACGSAGAHSRFFAVRKVRRFGAGGASGLGDHRTVVFGYAGPSVTRVTVSTPDGDRDAARAASGGAFAVVLGPEVSSTQIGVTFHLTDGTMRGYRGIRQANVVPPPVSVLDGEPF